jgi:GNAT superfamily N-acetyltransferase
VIGARSATPPELAVVVALARSARELVANQRGGVALVATSPSPEDRVSTSEAVLVGTIGDVTVGYLCGGIDNDRATVHELFVEPDARGVGVGHALIGAAATWAATAGCRHLDAAALPGDRGTKNFFEAHGMTSRLLIVSRALTVVEG